MPRKTERWDTDDGKKNMRVVRDKTGKFQNLPQKTKPRKREKGEPELEWGLSIF